ncbi:hypothetical protein Tco_0241970 [Tanacetum coccineum]
MLNSNRLVTLKASQKAMGGRSNQICDILVTGNVLLQAMGGRRMLIYDGFVTALSKPKLMLLDAYMHFVLLRKLNAANEVLMLPRRKNVDAICSISLKVKLMLFGLECAISTAIMLVNAAKEYLVLSSVLACAAKVIDKKDMASEIKIFKGSLDYVSQFVEVFYCLIFAIEV